MERERIENAVAHDRAQTEQQAATAIEQLPATVDNNATDSQEASDCANDATSEGGIITVKAMMRFFHLDQASSSTTVSVLFSGDSVEEGSSSNDVINYKVATG